MKITRTSKDSLTSQVWKFAVCFRSEEIQVVVDEYHFLQRSSKRHKFLLGENSTYLRLFSRDSTCMEKDVPLPTDVIEEARQNVVNWVKVGRWSDFKG